ncbi:MAG: hypothetical protein ACUZ8H_05535 [Candidatus Anammoxibacter sp.]
MAATYPFINYRVLITPLVSEGVYGTAIDVTQDIDMTDLIKSFSNVRQEIDNGDYDIGIFTFGNLTMNAINFKKKFSNEHEALSIFPFTRDKAKVLIQYRDKDANEITRFKGLINEDATRMDIKRDIVRFKVLSQDSIFRQVNVPSGAIVAGDLFSTVIKKILNVPAITDVLTFSAANINVNLDIAIDDGEVFSDTVVKNSLDQLLLASNSILLIDSSDNIIVKERSENVPLYALFGNGDPHGRENILSIKNFNNGLHRVFNSVKVGDVEVTTDTAWVSENGFRQKELSFDFITTESKEKQIADRVSNHFRVPKMELDIVVKTEAVKQIRLLDLVRVAFDYQATPDQEDDRLPMYGVAKYGEVNYANTTGSFRITQNISWKVYGISENAKNFTTTLKLRQTGTETHDGYFLSSLQFDKTFNSQNLPII